VNWTLCGSEHQTEMRGFMRVEAAAAWTPKRFVTRMALTVACPGVHVTSSRPFAPPLAFGPSKCESPWVPTNGSLSKLRPCWSACRTRRATVVDFTLPPARKSTKLLPALGFRGELKTPRLHPFSTPHVRIETDPPCWVHGDGELLGLTPVDVAIVRKAVRVLCPDRNPRG
jgi:hypothetical protein